MIPHILNIEEKKLAGQRMRMSFSENKTPDLWKSFRAAKHEIKNAIGTDLYSVQFYTDGFFENFNPDAPFEKWAAIEVTSDAEIPKSMETLTIKGLYAIFDYKGNSNDGDSVFRYIFTQWLPKSGYVLDSRPHFEILGSKYKNNDPESEEQICIPVRLK